MPDRGRVQGKGTGEGLQQQGHGHGARLQATVVVALARPPTGPNTETSMGGGHGHQRIPPTPTPLSASPRGQRTITCHGPMFLYLLYHGHSLVRWSASIEKVLVGMMHSGTVMELKNRPKFRLTKKLVGVREETHIKLFHLV